MNQRVNNTQIKLNLSYMLTTKRHVIQR